LEEREVINERAGKLKTNLSGEAAYESFVPSPLPPRPPLEMDNDMAESLVKANKQLVILYLIEKGVLSKPVLYVSYFLKKNRIEYYDRMSEVRDKGSFEQWVKFFLQAIYESAKDAAETAGKLIALHEHNVETVSGFGRASKTAFRLLRYMEENPIIEISKTSLALGAAVNTVSDAVKRLTDAGILTQTAGRRRNRTFAYDAYLKILREGT
jgi:Fic family protein